MRQRFTLALASLPLVDPSRNEFMFNLAGAHVQQRPKVFLSLRKKRHRKRQKTHRNNLRPSGPNIKGAN